MQLSIVSYFDAESTKTIRALQQQMYELTGSIASLQAWEPHVTIGDGIEIDENDVPQIINAIHAKVVNIPSFIIKASGFGALSNRPIGINEVSTPYVIWLNVLANQDLLGLNKAIEETTDQYKKWYEMPKPYTPHVTIAFRDLDEKGYVKGLELVKKQKIQINMLIDHVSLVEKCEDIDREIARVRFGLE